MEINTNKIGQSVLKWTVVGGSAVIAVNSVIQLFKSTNVKSAIMPAVTLLVGVSAFSYAMTAEKISLVPTLDKNESVDENKSSFRGSALLNESTVPNYSGRKTYTVRECKDKNGYITTTINNPCPSGTKEHSSTTVTTN